MSKSNFNSLIVASFDSVTKQNGKSLTTMTVLGRDGKDKNLKKVSNYLKKWFDNDEEVIALFNANRMKPQTDGLVLTNHRMIAVTGMRLGRRDGEIKIVNETAAKDILEFVSEKGLGKIIKLIVVKKDGERVYTCMMSQEDITTANSLLPKMTGCPEPIAAKMNITKMQTETEKAQEKVAKQTHKELERQAKQVAKQEHKASEVAALRARGKQLGYARLTYNGGLGNEYKTNKNALLECYENEILFKHRKAPIAILANQITGFEVTGQKQTSTNSRITVTRMLTLGVFSLAAPKRSTVTTKETYICISLKDGRQLFFYSSSDAPETIQRKLANAISHYSSLQTTEDKQQQSPPTQNLDVAGEIARFADLRKQGLLTDAEFAAKKKQLLDL